MEYWREKGNEVQAGLALNAGLLLKQYLTHAESLPEEKKYDATLTICILQSLLTSCQEFLDAMSENHGPLFGPGVSHPAAVGADHIVHYAEHVPWSGDAGGSIRAPEARGQPPDVRLRT